MSKDLRDFIPNPAKSSPEAPEGSEEAPELEIQESEPASKEAAATAPRIDDQEGQATTLAGDI